LDVKREDFAKLLRDFENINSALPRGEGLKAITTGGTQKLTSMIPGMNAVAKTYLGAAKNLAITVARLKEVGNLSAAEQPAAMYLVPYYT